MDRKFVCATCALAAQNSAALRDGIATVRPHVEQLPLENCNRFKYVLDRLSVKKNKQMNDLSHRLCCAPMMDWTDRHCRYFLRLVSPRARLYTEMVTTGALQFGNVPRHLDFDPAEHPDRAAARRQRSLRARALRAPGRGLGLRRDQPERRLSQRARADRQLRRLPDGRARAGRAIASRRCATRCRSR